MVIHRREVRLPCRMSSGRGFKTKPHANRHPEHPIDSLLLLVEEGNGESEGEEVSGPEHGARRYVGVVKPEPVQ